MSSQLQIAEVSKSFGGVLAVNRVSLEVRRGEILSVIGPNGAGKTTLLNMVSGFYHPDSGRITLDATDISQSAPSRVAERGVARTFQNIALFKGMTVLDNLLIGRHIRQRCGVLAGGVYYGAGRREEVEHRRAVEEIVDFLEIQPIRKQLVGTLAYGLQKRVELARALALEPKILLLDEPMAGMNAEEKEDMARFVIDANEDRGTTVVMIEHDMGVVMDVSRRVVVLDFGEKIADGTPQEVKRDPDVQRAYLGQEDAG
jgi:branched-chain amino acid transport system ATP-binding protein